jgi:hypothetical protein
MASSYSADLKLELMATGEKSGLWGDITNTNLNIVQQAIAGYEEVSIAGGVQTTALTFSNGLVSNGKNAVIKFTGTITGNQTVTIPDSIEKVYVIENGTVGAFSVEFKTVSGTGVTFAAADKGQKFLYSNGTNVVDIALASPPGGSDKQIQFNDNGAFGGITMGTTGQVLTTDGTTASFGDISGGASWQAVITADPANAVAGNGYFCNTTGGAFTVTLPTAATIGDFISFIDYAGTFDTNNLTIGRNGHNIQGTAADLTVATERAGFTLVYVDATQGWLLQNN